jgi:glutamate racemase
MKVGVLDSGVGGLGVLAAVRRQLPGCDLVYLADLGHAPYGDRPVEFVQERAMALTGFLVSEGAELVIVGCNTATVVGIQGLRSRFAVPVVGTEPGIRPAASLTRNGVVGVLGTSLTLLSARVRELAGRHPQVRYVLQPCPGLAAQVDAGELGSPKTRAMLASYLEPILVAGADTLVLGCTHYGFLAPQIRHLVGSELRIVDPFDAVARQAQRVLLERGRGLQSTGSQVFYTTGKAEPAQHVISMLHGAPVEVRQVAA